MRLVFGAATGEGLRRPRRRKNKKHSPIRCADVGGKGVAVEIAGGAPGHIPGLLGHLDALGGGVEEKYQVVMKVVGVGAFWRNAVDVDADERRIATGCE